MSEAPAPLAEPAAPLDRRGVALRLVKGSVAYGAVNFGSKALGFFLIPVYAHYLTPSDYGTVALAEAVAVPIAVLGGLGLAGGATRLYFQYVDDAPAAARYMATVILSVLVSGALTIGVSYAAVPPLMRLFGIRSVPFFPFIALAIATAMVIQVSDLRLLGYQLLEQRRAYARLSAAVFLMTAGAVLTLVAAFRLGAYGMLLGKLVGAAAAAGIALVLLRQWLAAGWQWSYLRETLALSAPIVPHELMAFGLIAADRFILEHYRPLGEVGIYTIAYSFGMVMGMLTRSVGLAWSPIFFDLVRKEDSGRQLAGRLTSSVFTFYTAVACIGVLLSEHFCRVALDSRYAGVGAVVPWVIGGYLLHALFGLFHLSILQGKRTGLLLAASVSALVANLTLNVLWIPKWGIMGAAYATTAAYAIEAAIMYVAAQWVHPIPYSRRKILSDLGIFSAALAVSQQTRGSSSHIAATLLTLLACMALLAVVGGRDLRYAVRELASRSAAAPPGSV